MEYIKDKHYSYIELENDVNEHDFEMEELGNFGVGENFIVLKDSRGDTASFILDGYTNVGIYKCVYNNG